MEAEPVLLSQVASTIPGNLISCCRTWLSVALKFYIIIISKKRQKKIDGSLASVSDPVSPATQETHAHKIPYKHF